MNKPVLIVSILIACSVPAISSVADEYRLPPLTMFAFSFEGILEDQHGESLTNHVDRLPADLSIVFESGDTVIFPAEITAVLAVKPRYGKARSRLLIPLQHQGEGRYQFGGTSDELNSAYSWFREHTSDFGRGQIVIEHFDGLKTALDQLNGRHVETSLRATYGDHDVSRLINPDYSHLTTAYFDAFPYKQGFELAPEVYHRVPVEILDAVQKETFDNMPKFARQRIIDSARRTTDP